MAGSRIDVRGQSYHIDRQIGHGLHSLVYSGHDLRDNRPVAIKIISFAHGSMSVKAETQSRRQSYFKEIGMLLYLQPLNPYIIRVFNHDQNDQQGIIVMERGTTLRDTFVAYMLRHQPIPGALMRQFWFQMVEAIAYLHELGIVHGDVKPENFIQVGPDRRTLRLIDMGISFQLQGNATSRLKTAAGTPDYVPPEVVKSRAPRSDKSRTGYQSDIWALGVILYEMAFGFRPLQSLPNNQAKIGFLGRIRGDIDIPKHPDKNLRNVLKGVLRSDPRRRLSADQVLRHPYLTRKKRSFFRRNS